MTTETGRTEGDSWDLASSVGATATMVAAARARGVAGTRCAARRSAGRSAGPGGGAGPLHPDHRRGDRPRGRRAAAPQGADRADHRADQVFRRLLHWRDRGRHPSGGDPGIRPGHQGLPIAMAGGHGGLRDRPATGHRVQDATRWPASAPPRPPTAARSASICATTGRRRCGTTVLTSPSRPRGSRRGCWSICRPRPRTGCSTTSPHCQRAGQPGGHRARPRPQRVLRRARAAAHASDGSRFGFDLNMADLFYQGERSTSSST